MKQTFSNQAKQDRRVTKILQKTRTSLREATKPSLKDENERIQRETEFNTLHEKGKKAIGILSELSKWCDAPNPGSENSPERLMDYAKSRTVLTDGIRDIQKKNKQIRSILDEMTNEMIGNGKGLLHVMELENVFKKK